ncbi:MAG: hypothetical protein JSW07_18155 [bacterium]|nr:MAG: hypothetical protein JSW07_18155 [bacterium]
MAVTIGDNTACTDMEAAIGYTLVSRETPASAECNVDYICLYLGANSTGIEAATFAASGNNLTTNGTASLPNSNSGQNEYNAPGDFTAFAAAVDDHIGAHVTTGSIDFHQSGGATGMWYKNGDYIPCSGEAFSASGNDRAAVYATGTEVGAAGAPTGALDGPLVGCLGGPIGN